MYELNLRVQAAQAAEAGSPRARVPGTEQAGSHLVLLWRMVPGWGRRKKAEVTGEQGALEIPGKVGLEAALDLQVRAGSCRMNDAAQSTAACSSLSRGQRRPSHYGDT